MQVPAALDALRDLGLNRLESDVYALLLVESEPLTAYRIGKKLGKPSANVYKAIDALAAKGAVLLDRSEPQLCRPVAASEFLDRLEHGFQDRLASARAELERLSEPPPDERVYQIEDLGGTLARARAMLGRAERIVVIEAFPRAAAAMGDALHATVARGVDLYLQLYAPLPAPLEAPNAHVIESYEGDQSRAHWRGEQLNLVVDGREVLLALLGPELDRVHQTLWSNSLYLACLTHAGMMREHFYNEVGRLVDSEPADSPWRRLVEEHPRFHTIDVPGQRELFERYGMPPTGAAGPAERGIEERGPGERETGERETGKR